MRDIRGLWNESEDGLRGLSVKSGSNVILDDSPPEEFSSLEKFEILDMVIRTLDPNTFL